MTTNTAPTGLTPQRGGLHSPGVHTALSVLEALVLETPLGLSDLASRLGVPKSSLSRVCSILIQRGWVIRDQTARYDLGIRPVALPRPATGSPVVSGFPPVDPARLARHN